MNLRHRAGAFLALKTDDLALPFFSSRIDGVMTRGLEPGSDRPAPKYFFLTAQLIRNIFPRTSAARSKSPCANAVTSNSQ